MAATASGDGVGEFFEVGSGVEIGVAEAEEDAADGGGVCEGGDEVVKLLGAPAGFEAVEVAFGGAGAGSFSSAWHIGGMVAGSGALLLLGCVTFRDRYRHGSKGDTPRRAGL